MSLEESMKEGLRTSKYFAGVMFLGVLVLFAVSWFYAGPGVLNTIEVFGISYVFGCSLGIMTGRDFFKLRIKEALQRSEKNRGGER